MKAEDTDKANEEQAYRVKARKAGEYFGLVDEVLSDYDEALLAGYEPEAAYMGAIMDWDLETPEEVEAVLAIPYPEDKASSDEWLTFAYSEIERTEAGLERSYIDATFKGYVKQGFSYGVAAFGALTEWQVRQWYHVPLKHRVAYSAVKRCRCCGLTSVARCSGCGLSYHSADGCGCMCGTPTPPSPDNLTV